MDTTKELFSDFKSNINNITKIISPQKENILNNIKSKFILRFIFDYIPENKRINLVKYNKILQQNLFDTILGEIFQKYLIEIELTIDDKKNNNNKFFRFINPIYMKYCNIYLNNDYETNIKKNYIYSIEKISKIKIYLYNKDKNDLNNLFCNYFCLKEIKFIKCNMENINLKNIKGVYNDFIKYCDFSNFIFNEKVNNIIIKTNSFKFKLFQRKKIK